jgi:hypothetical protein
MLKFEEFPIFVALLVIAIEKPKLILVSIILKSLQLGFSAHIKIPLQGLINRRQRNECKSLPT